MDSYDSPRSSVPARLPSSRVAGALAPRFGTPQPESAPSPISLRVALRGARRYWWLVLSLWLVGSAALGAIIYKNVKPQFLAESLLRVDPSNRELYVAQSGENLEAFLSTQVDLIKSTNVLTTAAADPKAARLERIQTSGDPVLELRRAIAVRVRPGTFLIEVAMTSPSAYEASTLVNAVVDAFNASNVDWSSGMTRAQIKSLETSLAELKNQSTELERQWKDIVARGEGGTVVVQSKTTKGTKAGAGDTMTENQVSLTVEHFRRLQEEDSSIQLRLAELDGFLAMARQAEQQGSQSEGGAIGQGRIAALESRMASDPELAQLKAQYHAAREKVEQIGRTARDPNDPALRRAKGTMAGVLGRYQEAYKLRETSLRQELESPTGAAGGEADREFRAKESEAANLKIRRVVIQDELKQLKLETKHQATDEVEITLIRKRLENLQGMQETVNNRLEQMKYESKGENRIKTVQVAVAHGKAISDKRMTYLAVTPVGILAAVLGLIVLLEIRSGRVADPDLLSSRVRHEVFSIAPLPNIRPGEDANDDKAEQRLARFVQSLDHLRVALCEGGIPGEGRCVMITSATGGEGKTTLSAHLAARCANAGTSTLLIDADMRRASLGRLLDVPAGPGLGDVLAGEAELDEALITVQAGGFHFLSAGMPGRDPSRVLKSARLAELIGRLRQTYDLVIIDTPPVLPVADALILGRWADGAVMAARYDASRLPLVERANRQLAVAGIPVLGVVVNGVRGQNANYGNYAYSYNYPGRVAETPDHRPA